MSSRILVTGGGGFLGKNLVRRLLDRGEVVRVLARGEYPELAKMGAQCFRGDVSDARAIDAAICGDGGVDSVFHVASKVGYWGRRADYVRTNIGGSKNIVDACVRAGVGKLVYTSTPSVVIGTKGWVENADETRPYPKRHLWDYAATKAQAEALVLAANGTSHAKGKLETCAIRPHFIFGPGDPQIVPRLLEHAHKGTLVRIGRGMNKVDITYIDNAVSAHILAHDALAKEGSPVGGQAYFIGQEAPVVLWDFIDRILRSFGAPPVKKHIPLGLARVLGTLVEGVYKLLNLSGEPPLTRSVAMIMGTSHYFSHAKAQRDFGYEPKVSTEEGLEKVLSVLRG